MSDNREIIEKEKQRQPGRQDVLTQSSNRLKTPWLPNNSQPTTWIYEDDEGARSQLNGR